jgi:hypothetical protein
LRLFCDGDGTEMVREQKIEKKGESKEIGLQKLSLNWFQEIAGTIRYCLVIRIGQKYERIQPPKFQVVSED